MAFEMNNFLVSVKRKPSGAKNRQWNDEMIPLTASDNNKKPPKKNVQWISFVIFTIPRFSEMFCQRNRFRGKRTPKKGKHAGIRNIAIWNLIGEWERKSFFSLELTLHQNYPLGKS